MSLNLKKVLFICMPYARPSFGSLALATLKSICRQAGVDSEIRYLNLDFARAIGECIYLRMGEVHDGEICFTPDLFPEVRPEDTWRQYIGLGGTRAPAPDSPEAQELRRSFLDLAEVRVPRFLDQAMANISPADIDIVGFSVGFNQTIASLALATRIRKRYPEIRIVFGGASCDGEAGPALLEHFDVLDVVVSGPADDLIVPLIRALRERQPLDRWPQVHCRATTPIRPSAGTEQTRSQSGAYDLDRLPIPDFDEYFEAVADFDSSEPIMIPYESSRGCWWGQNGQCTFCGLNGSTIAFRPKSGARVLAELRTQYERHGVLRFYACDCILSMDFFKSLLPGLQELHRAYGLNTFYELKSNLRTDQVHQLRQAGITCIQPGIESFSDHVLKLMNKGTNGLNQVRFLRDCVSAGLRVRYGILWGNPGEKAEDYHQMNRVIPFIHHLPPPHYLTPMTLQKFSPYSTDPDKYHLENLRPAGIYRVMYGGRPFDYDKLAYILTFEHAMDHDQDLRSAWQDLFAAVNHWRITYRPYSLISCSIDGVLYIVDRRAETRVYETTELQKALLSTCANGVSRERLARLPGCGDAAPLEDELEALIERRLILPWQTSNGSGTRCLSLPVPVSPYTFERILNEVRQGGSAQAAEADSRSARQVVAE
jgi:ribosomal peptide maturation radical SAM protein 1